MDSKGGNHEISVKKVYQNSKNGFFLKNYN
jgi:hypothetical protein